MKDCVKSLIALAVFAGIMPAVVRAQETPQIGLFAGATAIRVRDAANGRVQTLTANVPTGQLTASVGRFFVADAFYAQGTLTPQGTFAARDYVEGRLLGGVRIVKSLSIMAGPHARSYVLSSGTRRRLLWELRGTLETPVVSSLASARLDVWTAVSGNSNIDETLDHARGGEAALTVHIPRSPVWGKLGYRVERASFDAAARAETVEGLVFTIGVGWGGNRR